MSRWPWSKHDHAVERARKFRLRSYQLIALLTTALIFAQAILAGRLLFVDSGAVNAHEVVANFLFLVVVVQLLIAFAAPFTPRYRVPLGTALLFVLTAAQIGLGYAGRDDPDVASIHVPLGVLLFGVSTSVAVLSFLDGHLRPDDAAVI